MTDPFENKNLKSVNTSDLPDDLSYPLPDLTYLKEMAEGDEAFVKEIITYFLESTPELLRLMRDSALAGDREKLRFSAHKLLPQLTFVGILAAVPDVEKIERESKVGSECKHVGELSVIIDRAIKAINYGIEDLKKMV